MSDGYNGWKNYETWLVALWIDNDQGTYSYSRELVSEAADGEEFPKVRAADALEEWIKDEILPDLGASLASDLLNAAISEVDWFEIAENYLAELAEETSDIG
jgi:hypothetical protein